VVAIRHTNTVRKDGHAAISIRLLRACRAAAIDGN
jgi:hypothetical protein